MHRLVDKLKDKKNRFDTSKDRIFIGIYEVSGVYARLNQAFRENKLKSDFIEVEEHRYGYRKNSEQRYSIIQLLWRKSYQFRSSTPKSNLIKKVFSIFLNNFMGICMVLDISIRYKVIIFSYGISFFSNKWDLRLFNLLNKIIVFPFTGSDSRPPYISIKNYRNKLSDMDYIFSETFKLKENLDLIEKYATYLINVPPQSQMLTRDFIDFVKIGQIADFPQLENLNEDISSFSAKDDLIVALHAPTDRRYKGTEEIIRIVENIKERGVNLELRIIENKKNIEVLHALKNCDFIIDSLNSDAAVGQIGIEGAFFKKPSVLSGMYSSDIDNFYDHEEKIPSMYVLLEEVEDAIFKMATDKDFRRELGKKAHSFITQKWNSKRVVNNYIQLFRGQFPSEWYTSPSSISHIFGDLEENMATELLTKYTQIYGLDGLLLDDKPRLKEKFHRFINDCK